MGRTVAPEGNRMAEILYGRRPVHPFRHIALDVSGPSYSVAAYSVHVVRLGHLVGPILLPALRGADDGYVSPAADAGNAASASLGTIWAAARRISYARGGSPAGGSDGHAGRGCLSQSPVQLRGESRRNREAIGRHSWQTPRHRALRT